MSKTSIKKCACANVIQLCPSGVGWPGVGDVWRVGKAARRFHSGAYEVNAILVVADWAVQHQNAWTHKKSCDPIHQGMKWNCTFKYNIKIFVLEHLLYGATVRATTNYSIIWILIATACAWKKIPILHSQGSSRFFWRNSARSNCEIQGHILPCLTRRWMRERARVKAISEFLCFVPRSD